MRILWGAGGIVTTAIGTGAVARSMIIQPDGKIVAAGRFVGSHLVGSIYRFVLIRYNPDGTPDTGTPVAINNFAPKAGLPGSNVSIIGKGFGGATSVTFGGTPQPAFTVSSSFVIRTTVPVGAVTGPVCVTTLSGTACSAMNFTLPPPTLRAFAPKHSAVGKTVTIIGNYFTGETSVTFNGTPAAFTVSSNFVIKATVPAGATTGPISVTTPYGTATSMTNFAIP